PVPSEIYLEKSLKPSTRLSLPAQLLVILDLNGTLLYRTKGRSAAGSSLTPTLRPGLREFLAYLLSNFKVMIWTSARPENAARMVNAAFKEDEKGKLLAVWGRDTLGLTQAQYNAKVQVYKVLSRIWEGEFMVYHPDQPDSIVFDQTNTVLFDDSTEKAVGHPYNHVHIPEFLATKDQIKSDAVLRQCIDYLEEVKWQSNVSEFIRQHPFVYTPAETIGGVINKETEGETSF
ncbi:HAD-like domain-containing protein, partial [Trichophaea hybrida]